MGRNSGGGGRTRRPVGGGTGGMDAAERNRLADVGVAILNGPLSPAPSQVVEPAAAPAQTAGLLEDSRVTRMDNGSTWYSFGTTSGTGVRLSIVTASNNQRDAEIIFTVNNDVYRDRNLSQAESNAISMRLLRHMREDAKTRPDGFTYHAFAATGDGNGVERGRAYEAVGMSRPANGYAGGTQYAVVQNGKMRPDMARLKSNEGDSRQAEREWAEVKGQNQENRSRNR